MSSTKRSLLVCKFCSTQQKLLHRHLRGKCRKNSAESDIAAIVEEARSNRRKVLASFSLISCQELAPLGLSLPQMEQLVHFFQARGSVITDKSAGAKCPALSSAQAQAEEREKQRRVSRRSQRPAYQGRYQPHCPVLQGFRDYLKKSHKFSGIRQMVDNICRFLYFIDPEKISTELFHSIQKSEQFLMQLMEGGASQSTIKTYFNCIKHFTRFLGSGGGGAEQTDGGMCSASKVYLKLIEKLQSKFSYKLTKAAQTRRKRGAVSTPDEWQKILSVTRTHLAQVMEKGILEDRDKTTFLYCLEAIVILKYLHPASVIQKMSVRDWLERTHCMYQFNSGLFNLAVVKVGSDVLVLDEKEEQWFQLYFNKIRTSFLASDSKDGEYFFLSSKGETIKHCTRDLTSLHEKFGLPRVTSCVARAAFKKWSLQHLNPEDQQLTKAYLSRGSDSILDEAEIVHSALLVSSALSSRAIDFDEANHGAEQPEPTDRSAGGHAKEQCYIALVKAHPAGPHHAAPGKKEQRQVVCREHLLYCYDRWRRDQYKARMEDLIEHFRYNPPSDKQIQSYIERNEWTTNVPKPEEVKEKWKPQSRCRQTLEASHMEALVHSQEWRGISIVNDPQKGQLVVASMGFTTGQVVCDFHGQLISRREGKKIQESIPEEKCYLFFFRDKDTSMCIDARAAPCPCHPDIHSTYGRLINHSRKMDNVKSVVRYVDAKPTIVFLAKRDISPGTELLCDYGVDKRLSEDWENLNCLND